MTVREMPRCRDFVLRRALWPAAFIKRIRFVVTIAKPFVWFNAGHKRNMKTGAIQLS